MKTQNEIEIAIKQLFLSLQNKVTTYAKGSVIRGLVVSVSATVADLWNEAVQMKRRLFFETAKGNDIDILASQLGYTRREAVNLSTILVFKSDQVETGTSTGNGLNYLTDNTKTWTVDQFAGWKLYDSAGTLFTISANTAITLTVAGTPSAGDFYIFPVVPANTAVVSAISGKRYITQEEVVVGLSNPELLAQSSSVALGNRTIATCEVAGNDGVVSANELTTLETPIDGIDSVTNPVPSQPRTSADAESDDAFRQRIATYIATLDISTQAFFESLAYRGNEKVLRSFAKKSNTSTNTEIYVATRSGELLSDTELENLATYIYDRSRAFDTVVCFNMVMTDIFVNFEAYLPPDVDLDDYYVQVADNIADYLDYATWDMEEKIYDDNILVQINNVNSNVNVDLSTFTVEASKNNVFDSSKIITLSESFPRFARLKIKDTRTNTTRDYVLESYPINEQNNRVLNPYKFQEAL